MVFLAGLFFGFIFGYMLCSIMVSSEEDYDYDNYYYNYHDEDDIV